MPWHYSASKGTWRRIGGSSRKDIIKKRAKDLRKDGWKVTVYKVKS